jgi:hypothetical protein
LSYFFKVLGVFLGGRFKVDCPSPPKNAPVALLRGRDNDEEGYPSFYSPCPFFSLLQGFRAFPVLGNEQELEYSKGAFENFSFKVG